MSEAAASSGGATPQPMNPNAGALGKHKMSAESFLDGFAEDSGDDAEPVAEEAPPPRPRPQRERPGKAREPKPEPDEAEDDAELPAASEPGDEEPDTEIDDREGEGEEEGARLLPKGKGTRENPLSLKDLPKDAFLEVKIDGQKAVINLAEAVEGAYMRPEYFHRYVNSVKGDLAKAKQITMGAVRNLESDRAYWKGIFTSPENMLSYMFGSDEGEAVLEQVAIGFAKIRKAEATNPELRLRRVRARDERELARRREELDARERNDRTTRENNSKVAQLQASWKPGMDAGMKAAGFPQWTDELQEEVGVRLERIRRRNGSITAADWEAVIPIAAKAVGAQPASAPARRPAPAPRPAPRQEPTPRKPAGKNYDDVPHNVKMRDPSFFWR